MIGVGDKGRIHKETVGVLMGIFLHKHPKSLIWCMFGMHSWLLFWANRKGNTAGRQKPQTWFIILCRQAKKVTLMLFKHQCHRSKVLAKLLSRSVPAVRHDVNYPYAGKKTHIPP